MIKPKTVNRQMPTVPPDLDKLIRAVLDGLTGVAYKDDGQVVRISAVKIYAQKIGVQIGITEL
jgi:Holliday junction resolvase RusA-like endonuclease